MFSVLKVLNKTKRHHHFLKTFKKNKTSLMSEVLLRDYIQFQLYNEKIGYFSKTAKIGNSKLNTKLIPFNSLFDEIDYKLALKESYDKGKGAWLTPIEVFSPHYGEAIATHILESFDSKISSELKIIEIGGGSGTCLVDVMSSLRKLDDALFKKTKYTVIEISKRLAAEQRAKALANELAEDNFEIVNEDFLKMNQILSQNPNTFVIALELLDNLPHDKIVFDSNKEPWEAMIIPKIKYPSGGGGYVVPGNIYDQILAYKERHRLQSSKYRELYRKSKDPLVLETINLMNDAEKELFKIIDEKGIESNDLSKEPKTKMLARKLGLDRVFGPILDSRIRKTKTNEIAAASAIFKKIGITYIPTGQIQFLKTLKSCIPIHKIILSDYDALPGEVMPGANGPAVQTIENDMIHENTNYLFDEDGIADIFFPTDFFALKFAYENITGFSVDVLGPEKFFKKFPNVVKNTTTGCGYQPLLEDYSNTAYLISN